MNTRKRVLVIEDEANARKALVTSLSEQGYDVDEAADGEAGFERLHAFAPDVVLCDVQKPKIDGIDLLRRSKAAGLDAAFVMVTAFGSIEVAVEAMRAGAESFVVKPVDSRAVSVIVQKVLEKQALRREAAMLRERVQERFRFHNIVGEAPELQTVFDLVKRAAPTKDTVLILGESGTGKELIAQAIHEESPRRKRPFIKVNCAALTESLLESELFGHEKGSFTGAVARKVGRVELADGGTLFLDEVGEIPASIQLKLLRVLQTGEFERMGGTQSLKVDVRLVAATTKDLAGEVKAGRFRDELFYRLNVVALTLPPLRARKGDIPALFNHFVEKYAKLYGKEIRRVSPGVVNALLAHDWPGNARELENVTERAVVLARGSELSSDDLPTSLRGPRPERRSAGWLIPGATLQEIEREAILRTLEMVGGSTSRAADVLGISVRKIQYRLKEYAEREGGVERGDEGLDA